MIAVAIGFASVAAIFLALAARLQHHGVQASGSSEKMGMRTIAAMVRNRQWLSGSAMLGAGTGLHLVALALAPLAVVQPIGALAPALTTAFNARAERTRASRAAIVGVLAVTFGIALFVVVSAQQPVGGTPVRYAEAVAISVIGLIVAVAAAVAWRTHGRIRCVASALGGGMAFGLLSTLVRAGAQEFFGAQRIPVLIGTAAGMAVALTVGAFLVQQAYSSGPSELVIAAVTVFDPLVSIGLGAALLGETPAPTPSVLAWEILAAATAVAGIVLIAWHRTTEKAVLPQTPLLTKTPGLSQTVASEQEIDVTAALPRRILIGADTFPPDINGAANFAARLAVGLAAQGHDVHVICPQTVQTGAEMPELPGVTVHRFRAYLTPIHPTLSTCLPWQISGPMDQLIEELRPDVIHVQAHFVMGRVLAKIARRRRLPLVATNHFVPDNAFGYTRMPNWTRTSLSKLAWNDLNRFLRKANVVTTPTPRAAQLLIDHQLGQPVIPISCGVDLDHYQGAGAAAGSDPTILFVGRLDEEKRVPDILHALASLDRSDIRLEIVGDGGCRTAWQALADRLGLSDRVIFHGFVSDRELTAAYARCDVFCMPSTAELQSLVTMEAMAAGKPVVAADAMALPHLVRPGRTGWLFEPGNVTELAERLRQLVDDPVTASRMGGAGRQLVAQHGIAETVSRYERVYESVLPSRRELPVNTHRTKQLASVA
jgi:glycosyltransferase involved in cell wall biosynthesis